MTTAELLYQKVQALPEVLQYQAIGYIDSLLEKWQQPKHNHEVNLTNSSKTNLRPLTENNKLTVDEAFNAITIKTDKHATVEQMNESIAHAFENWQG